MLFYRESKVCSTMALSENVAFPVQVELLADGVNVQQKGEQAPVYWPVYTYDNADGIMAPIADSMLSALSVIACQYADKLNDVEKNSVNAKLAQGDYLNARQRALYRVHVVQSLENENLFTLSVSHKTVDNDLSSDMFICSLLKSDVNDVISALEKLVRKELSGKAFERTLEKCYTDLKLTSTNTINKTRRVYLEGYYKTRHNTTDDYYTRTLAKCDRAGLFSAILASDSTIALTKDDVKRMKEKKACGYKN